MGALGAAHLCPHTVPLPQGHVGTTCVGRRDVGEPLWESRAPSSPPRPLTWVASWPPRGPQDLRLLFPSVVPHSLRPQNLKLKCPFLLWGPATQLSSLS